MENDVVNKVIAVLLQTAEDDKQDPSLRVQAAAILLDYRKYEQSR